MKKVLLATMIAAVCAFTTAGGVNAPLLDVERTNTNVIVAGTPAPEPSVGLRPTGALEVIDTPSTTTTVAAVAVVPTSVDVTPSPTTAVTFESAAPTTVDAVPTSTTTTTMPLGPDNAEPTTTTIPVESASAPEVGG